VETGSPALLGVSSRPHRSVVTSRHRLSLRMADILAECAADCVLKRLCQRLSHPYSLLLLVNLRCGHVLIRLSRDWCRAFSLQARPSRRYRGPGSVSEEMLEPGPVLQRESRYLALLRCRIVLLVGPIGIMVGCEHGVAAGRGYVVRSNLLHWPIGTD